MEMSQPGQATTQHLIDLLDLLKNENTYICVCGLKDMETGVLEVL